MAPVKELYRERLLGIERDLLRAIAIAESEGRETPDKEAQDPTDRATNAYGKEEAFERGSANRATLAAVRDALRRIQNGDFGTCTECGRPLDPRRLDAVPWTACCTTCQERLERAVL